MKPIQLPDNVQATLQFLVQVAQGLHQRDAQWNAAIPNNKENQLAELFDDGQKPTFEDFTALILEGAPSEIREQPEIAARVDQLLRQQFGQAWMRTFSYKWEIVLTLEGIEPYQVFAPHDAEITNWVSMLLHACWYIYYGNPDVDAAWMLRQMSAQGNLTEPLAVFQTVNEVLRLMGVTVEELTAESPLGAIGDILSHIIGIEL